VLQRQRGFSLLVNLVNPLQTLAKTSRKDGQQSLILEGERALLS
jgi:hypothetical protein